MAFFAFAAWRATGLANLYSGFEIVLFIAPSAAMSGQRSITCNLAPGIKFNISRAFWLMF